MAGPPKRIMIIRHGEKPPKHPVTTGPFDVQEDGESGAGKSLIVIGWQRAGALNGFFAPDKADPPKKDIAKPDYIYAGNPQGESQRPWELSGTVLICWEHHNIMPNIVGAINNAIPITNYKSIPGLWPDVFYLVWVFDLDNKGKSYTWNEVHQNLMAGDV